MYNYPIIVVAEKLRVTVYNRKQLRKVTNKFTSKTEELTPKGKKKIRRIKNYEILNPRKVVAPIIDVQQGRVYPVVLTVSGRKEGESFKNHKGFHYAKRKAIKEKQKFTVVDANGITIFSNL